MPLRFSLSSSNSSSSSTVWSRSRGSSSRRSSCTGSCTSTESKSQSDAGSSKNSSTSGSYSGIEEPDSKVEIDQLRLKLRKQAQTAKARAASIASKAARRVAKATRWDVKAPPHRAEAYREHVKGTNFLARPGIEHVDKRQRLRLLVSYMRGWMAALAQFFQNFQGSSNSSVHHTISTVVVDDTNMRLSQTDSQVHQWKSSRVVSVMNVVQTLIACYGSCTLGNGERTLQKVFTVHTPLACLPKADLDGLYFELISRLCLFMGEISYRFRILHEARDMICKVSIQATAMCMDALATNQAVLKRLRLATRQKHIETQYQQVFPVLAVLCLIHGLALARKCLLTSIPQFWSSVVRLGHLFEVGSFRASFKRALAAVIYKSFRYIVVAEEPSNSEDWKQRRQEWRNISFDPQPSGTFGKKRSELHVSLMQWDNGDFEGASITHHCRGTCCRQGGSDHLSKGRFALIQILKHYLSLFGTGYPTPLAYRWVHASRALQYIKVTWLPEPLRVRVRSPGCLLRNVRH